MDQQYLEDLLAEVQNRDGGLVLNIHDKPEVVVLSINRYNELLAQSVPIAIGTNEPVLADPVEPKTVLVTGGAGYIGANVARELMKGGYRVIIIDNLSTGRRENIPDGAVFVEGDCGDANLVRDIFSSQQVYAVVHLAASLEVEESVREPEKYFRNNVLTTAGLLSVMAECGVKRILFSSTGSVYGQQDSHPVPETAKAAPANPYGHSKFLAERIIKFYSNYLGLQSVIFRYFNVCGADLEGLVASGHTSHILPIVMEAAAGKRKFVTVYGDDYETFDGTCIRDYIHVLDIARAHVLALGKMDELGSCQVYNIGTGRGLSVRELINAAAEVTGHIIPMEVGARRPGDVPAIVADAGKIKRELGFVPLFSDPEVIISSSWRQIQKRIE